MHAFGLINSRKVESERCVGKQRGGGMGGQWSGMGASRDGREEGRRGWIGGKKGKEGGKEFFCFKLSPKELSRHRRVCLEDVRI